MIAPGATTQARLGVACALGAYLAWGLVPVFFKLLKGVPALEIIAHRVVWSALLMAALLALTHGFGAVRATLREPRRLARVALGAALMLINWLTFVWAVNADRILDTSLGYFITPLVSVALGVHVLDERLRPLQRAAVLLAAAGVVNEALRIGGLPWVSLVLAGSFGLYGLLRKQLPLDAASGLFLETLVTAPFALAWLLWLGAHGSGAFRADDSAIDLWLIASGAVTALPLLLFALAARRLRLATIGMLQYLAPTLSLLIATLVYREKFDLARGLSFAATWAGLALYSIDLLRAARRGTRA